MKMNNKTSTFGVKLCIRQLITAENCCTTYVYFHSKPVQASCIRTHILRKNYKTSKIWDIKCAISFEYFDISNTTFENLPHGTAHSHQSHARHTVFR